MRDCKFASARSNQANQARIACAVMSGLERSKGSVPQPLQNVGIPPSRFCKSNNHTAPARARFGSFSSGSIASGLPCESGAS